MSDVTTLAVRGHAMFVRRFEVEVVAGPNAGLRATSTRDELVIGTAASTDLVLDDAAVSRHHCALQITARGLQLQDLGSTNGTFAGDLEIARAFVPSGTRLRIGGTTIVVRTREDEVEYPLANTAVHGTLIGGSPAMRRLFPLLERYAASDACVLVRGEVGSGKSVIAEALADPARPYVVVDCTNAGDLPAAFAAAAGGVIVLEEVGALNLGSQTVVQGLLDNARVIATTSRDLRVDVNARQFRGELFYRLDVLHVDVPPLRDRDGDIALLAASFWRDFRDDDIPKTFVAELVVGRWPGNVRELRNAVERTATAGWAPPADATRLSYGDAKERIVRQWERQWVAALLDEHDQNLSAAARASGMGRSYLRQLCQRYGLRAKS